MNEPELIKMELEIQGIQPLDNGNFHVLHGENRKSTHLNELINDLNLDVKTHKKLFFEVWRDLIQLLSKPEAGTGNEITQRMFANSLKILLLQTERFPVLKRFSSIVAMNMSKDSARVSEKYMSNVIDSQIGLDWMIHVIKLNFFKLSLLKKYISINQTKTAADISGVQGPWSNFDLPMQERVWSYSEDEEDFNVSTRNKQQSARYRLPETYNDPYSFEEGFYWREIRNDPFDIDDKDENPYPHSSIGTKP